MIAVLIILVILLIFIYRRVYALNTDIHEAQALLCKQKFELIMAKNDVVERDVMLSKCRGDLSSCTGKTADVELSISALKSYLDAHRNTINTINGKVDWYDSAVKDFRSSIDNYDLGKRYSSEMVSHLRGRVAFLISQIHKQGLLIHHLRQVITSQDEKIRNLAA